MLEHMLRACMLKFIGAWNEYISLMEFVYNNQHHSSIQMAPYGAFYGRKCCNPICWNEEGMCVLEGPGIVQDTVNKVKLIRSGLKVE